MFTFKIKEKLGNISPPKKFVNKLRRQSIRNYFVERCTGGPKQKDFGQQSNPF
jgi:hypothetical protein